MSLTLDTQKEYGVVLEGGGAKGAFQIGALKALKELNINIKAVVGTSVGALNGVLVAQNDLEKAMTLWSNIKYSQVVNVEDEIVKKIANLDFKGLDMKKVFNKIMKVIMDRGVDITPLKKMIMKAVDEEKVRKSQIEFGLVTVSLSDRKPLELFIEDIEEGRLADFLLASSYLPVFKNEKLHGKRYVDGGFYNNTPMSMLIDKGYKNIIVIKIHGFGVDKKTSLKDINVFEIAPSENLGGILEFDGNKANYNLNLGYYDTIRRIKGLRGKKYYINVNKDEEYFINKILQMNHDSKVKFYQMLNLKNKSINRAILEEGIPRLAKKLDIENKWDYIDLIIAMLEYFGDKLNIERFNEYTIDEFVSLIKNRLQKPIKHSKKADKKNHQLKNLLIEFIDIL